MIFVIILSSFWYKTQMVICLDFNKIYKGNKMQTSFKEKIFEYVKQQFGSDIEYLWPRFPDNCIFRHNDNKKWYGVVMRIPYVKLGIQKKGNVDVLDVKTGEPLMQDLFIQQNGIYPAYHMSKNKWISILLDGTVDLKLVFELIDESFMATLNSAKNKNKLL